MFVGFAIFHGKTDNMFEEIVAASRASQNKEELAILLEFVDQIKPKNILEIGVHQGYSMEVWKKALNPTILIGVEKDTNGVDHNLISFLKAQVYFGDSHDPLTASRIKSFMGVGGVDFLFIDGDHTYEGVKKDFELYSPLVRKGGLIGLHDVVVRDNPGVEVWKFWAELKNEYDYSTIHKPDGTGTGVIFWK